MEKTFQGPGETFKRGGDGCDAVGISESRTNTCRTHVQFLMRRRCSTLCSFMFYAMLPLSPSYPILTTHIISYLQLSCRDEQRENWLKFRAEILSQYRTRTEYGPTSYLAVQMLWQLPFTRNNRTTTSCPTHLRAYNSAPFRVLRCHLAKSAF